MRILPWWSVPLISAGLGGLVTAGIWAEPRFPFVILTAVIPGAVLGVLSGLGVWFFNCRKSKGLDLDLTWPPKDGQSRFAQVVLLVVGTLALVVNHLCVNYLGRKWLHLVLGGSILLMLGFSSLLSSSARINQKLQPGRFLIAGVFALVGIILVAFLWEVAYP